MKQGFNDEDGRLSNRPLVTECVSNGEDPTSLTPPQPDNDQERGTRNYAPNSAVSDNKVKWHVMWATRNRINSAVKFYSELGIETFSPTETIYKVVDGKKVKKVQPLISNKFFVNISHQQLCDLRKENPSCPYLNPVLDKTHGQDGTYPHMIIPDGEMQNFIRLTTVGDEHVLLVTDPSRLTHMAPDKEYIVVDGRHKGLVGHRARYKKQERIVVKCGTLVFTTGYVPKMFVQAVKDAIDEK